MKSAQLVLNTLRNSTLFGGKFASLDSEATLDFQRGRALAQNTIRKDFSPDLANMAEAIGYLEYALEKLVDYESPASA